MNNDRLKYRFWEHEDWHDDNSPLKAVYCNIVDGCDPTIAVSDFEFCTGMKDKNGNLIYEGDIVRFEIVDNDSVLGKTFERICEICFGKGDYPYSFVCKNKVYCRGYALLSTMLGQEIESIEIIGNIHQDNNKETK